MAFDGRGPNESWNDDGTGMSMMQLTVTVEALSIS
jgi:hypothetical protein